MHIADMTKGMLGTNGVVAGQRAPGSGGGPHQLQDQGHWASVVRRLLRRRRGQPGCPPRVHEPGLRVETAGHLLLRKQRYAESTPVEYALSAANVADRAAGYDMPGFHVDGMDVFAVHEAAGEAVRRARAGRGPHPAGVQDLPLLRPHCLRQPAELPHPGGGGPTGEGGIPCSAFPQPHE